MKFDFEGINPASAKIQEMIALVDEFSGSMTEDQVKRASEVLRDHQIEKHIFPSARPGVEPDEDGTSYWGSNPKTLAFQQWFIERIVTRRGKEDVGAILGANRSTKSTTVWGMCGIKWVRDYAKQGDTIWAIAPTFRKLVEPNGPDHWFWQYLPKSYFPANVKYDEKNGLMGEHGTIPLQTPRGTVYLTRYSEEQDIMVFETVPADVILWTEAVREPLLDALLMRLTDRNGVLLIDCLPNKGWHTFRLENDPDVHSIRMGMQDNAHNLPRGLIAKRRRQLPPEEAAVRIDGEPRPAFGVVYTTFNPKVHVVEPFDIPDWWPLYMGGDWGFRHPHAFPLVTVSPTGKVFVIDEQYENEVTVPKVARKLWNLLGRYRHMDHLGYPNPDMMFDELDRLNHKARDAHWDEDLQMEVGGTNFIREHVQQQFHQALSGPIAIDNQVFQRHGHEYGRTLSQVFLDCGVPIIAAQKKNMDWSVEQIRRFLQDDQLFFFDRCKYLIRDHSSWRYKEKDGMPAPGDDKYAAEYKDGCDGMRYVMTQYPSHESVQIEAY